MTNLLETEAKLLGPGGPFEVCEETVLGERMQVFKNRKHSLREILADSAGFGDAEYMIYEERRIGFDEHLAQVASVAQALAELHGVGPGDRVAILGANSPEWVETFWATTALGAIAVGLNGWWAQDEILYGLEDCEPRVLIGDRKRLARLDGAVSPVPIIEMESDFAKLGGHASGVGLPTCGIDEDDPAVILYTSGTTGRPKGAVHTHRNVVGLIDLQRFHGLRTFMQAAATSETSAGPPCILNTTPLFHVSGLYTGAVTALANGIKTVWTAGRFDPVGVMRLIEREGVTNWGPMGTMAYRVVTHPDLGKHDLSSIRGVGSGGAPMSTELQQRIREAFPAARASMGFGYGLTESTALATMAFGDDLEKHPASVGRPLPTIQVEIRDDAGKPLPEGVDGEVCIRGPLNMREYWRRPEATREMLVSGGWLRSGDIGHMDDGRLFINSRARDLILRGAENIYPVEIEHRLEAHPDVEEAAVVGVDHEELGQEVKAIVVPSAGATLDIEVLATWVADRLAYFKVPAYWEIRRESLPRNAAGKVLKKVLTEGGENPFVEE